MKVENMKTSNGNAVVNQFIIRDDEGNVFFQSYDSIIAKIDKFSNVTLDERYWDYSSTTGKYRNMFLGEGINEARKNIKEGIYKLADLN